MISDATALVPPYSPKSGSYQPPKLEAQRDVLSCVGRGVFLGPSNAPHLLGVPGGSMTVVIKNAYRYFDGSQLGDVDVQAPVYVLSEASLQEEERRSWKSTRACCGNRARFAKTDEMDFVEVSRATSPTQVVGIICEGAREGALCGRRAKGLGQTFRHGIYRPTWLKSGCEKGLGCLTSGAEKERESDKSGRKFGKCQVR